MRASPLRLEWRLLSVIIPNLLVVINSNSRVQRTRCSPDTAALAATALQSAVSTVSTRHLDTAAVLFRLPRLRFN